MNPPTPTKHRALQVRMPVFVLLVAGCALILWAWKFNRANRNIPRAAMTLDLDKLARGNDPRTRIDAAAALRQLSPELAPEAMEPLLVAATRDADPAVRKVAINTVQSLINRANLASGRAMAAQVDRALPVLLTIIDDPDPVARVSAIAAVRDLLVKVAQSREGQVDREMTAATTMLRKALEDPDARVRADAAAAIASLHFDFEIPSPTGPTLRTTISVSPAPRRVLPALEKLALADPSPNVRSATILPILFLRPRPDEVPAALVTMLRKERDRSTLTQLLIRLADEGWRPTLLPPHRQAGWSNRDSLCGALLESIQAGSNVDPYYAATFLMRLGPPSREAVPALVETLHHESVTGLRESIAMALVNAPPGALDRDDLDVKHAITGILQAARIEIAGGRIDAALALAILDPGGPQAPEVRRRLMTELQKPDLHDDYFASLGSALAAFGPDAADELPDLIALFRQTTERTRRDVLANVFLHIGPPARDAIPLLAEYASEPTPAGKRGLFYASGTKSLDRLPPHVAAHALLAIDPDSPETRSLLIPMVMDAQPFRSSRRIASNRARQEFEKDARAWLAKLVAHDPAILRTLDEAAENEADPKRRSALLRISHELAGPPPVPTEPLP